MVHICPVGKNDIFFTYPDTDAISSFASVVCNSDKIKPGVTGDHIIYG